MIKYVTNRSHSKNPGSYRDFSGWIVVGTGQVRTRNVEKRIDELAESIRKVGLLNPIIVYQRDDGKYEVLTGQRRFLAHVKLETDTILAAILDRKITEIEAKV